MVNYAIQHRWVFNADGNHRQFAFRYAWVTSATFVLNLLVFEALYAGLRMWYVGAQAVATVVVFVANFEINRRFTFRTARDRS